MAVTGKVLRLKDVRLAFTDNLFVAGSYKNEAGKQKTYSCKLLIAKDHPQIGEVKTELARLAVEAWADKAEAVVRALRAENKAGLYDGDVKAYDGYENCYYVSASNKTKPLYVDRNPGTKAAPNLITAESGKLYSGCYVVAHISFWAQKNSFGNRINTNLLGLQLFRDGEAFSGGGVASVDAFANEDDGAQTVTAGADMFT